MARSEDKYSRRRLRSSYFSTIISISLVLIMLGMLGLVLLYAEKLSRYVKENISITIILKENVKEVDIIKLQKSLDATTYVKSTKYITQDEATGIMKEELGEDFMQFLEYNPLHSSIDVHLTAEYAVPDSIAWIKEEIVQDTKVKEVFYEPSLVEAVNENVKKISLLLLVPSVLLLIIAIALINNSIRLAVFSKRLLIRSMQLVGATNGFIRRPFVWKGIGNGLYGAFIAIAVLIGFIYWLQTQVPDLIELQDIELFASLFGIVTALGILISWLCTIFAVKKYLRMKSDQLY